jgi:hypothetical protein
LAELLFWSSRLAIILLVPLYISDISVYHSYAKSVVAGHQLVYRDFAFEYPPLAFLLIYLPGLVLHLVNVASDENYRILFGLLLLPFDYWIFAAHRRQDPGCLRAASYLLLSALLPYLLYDRLDLLVGLAVAYPFLSGPGAAEYVPLRAAVAWGLGGAYKLVPLLLLPVALFERALPRFTRLTLALVAALPLLAAVALALILARGTVPFFSHHSGRGVQIESIYAAAVFFGRSWLGLFAGASIQNNFGAQHLGGLPWLQVLGKGSFVLSLATTLPAVLLARWRERLSAAAAAWILMLTFVVFSYVLSPQFLFWLLPLAPLVAADLRSPWRLPWMVALLCLVLLTSIHFRLYWSYVAIERGPVLIVVARNLLLLALLAMSWIGFWKPASPKMPQQALDYSPAQA